MLKKTVIRHNGDSEGIKNRKLHPVLNRVIGNRNCQYTEYKLDSKYFVDSSPVMEKYFAKKTKVGWLGKHTNIVSKEYGSWLFLSEIFLPIRLTVDKKKNDNCGTCRSCIDICPTNAIISDYKIEKISVALFKSTTWHVIVWKPVSMPKPKESEANQYILLPCDI